MRRLQQLVRGRRRGRRPVDLARLGHEPSALLGVERPARDRPRGDGEGLDRRSPGQPGRELVFVRRRPLPERVRALYHRLTGRLRA
jgi:hypothetical protein